MMHILLALLLAAMLSGCATQTPMMKMENFDFGGTRVTKQQSIHPVAKLGIEFGSEWEEAFRTGNFVAVQAEFPPELRETEYRPARRHFPAFAVGNGREYTAQAVFAGYAGCSDRLAVMVIVIGTRDPRGVKALLGSTKWDEFYQLRSWGRQTTKVNATEGEAENFARNNAFRKGFIERHGSLLTEDPQQLIPREEVFRYFAPWKLFAGTDIRSDVGRIAVPPDTAFLVKAVAGTNPQYSFEEKFTGTAVLGVNLLYLPGTILGLLGDLYSASRASSLGWDRHSLYTPEQKEGTRKYLEFLRTAPDRIQTCGGRVSSPTGDTRPLANKQGGRK